MSRRLFVAGAMVFVAIVVWLAATDRMHEVARLGVPVMEPSYADVRSLSGAKVALDLGLDPMVVNPGDPWGRPFNYPRLWLLPAELGVGPEHTVWIAALMWIVFALGLAALAPLATTPVVTSILLLVLFAPATWLAVERANNDLAMFGLLALAAGLAERRRRTAAGLVAAAAALKLFPIFALGGLATEARSSRRSVLTVAALFAAYLVWMRADLPPIRANAPTWHPISYGITLLPRAIADRLQWSFAGLLAIAASWFVGVVGLAGRTRTSWRLGAAGSPHSLAAFRIGAGTFAGTFLLGSNFDYRLVFLLLAVPQLATWMRVGVGRIRIAAGLSVAVSMLVTWSMTWRAALTKFTGTTMPGLVVDEVLTWCLATCLCFLLTLTVPDWLLTSSRRDRPWLDGRGSR